jgi:hypothetical protein
LIDQLILNTSTCMIGLVGRLRTDRSRPALLIVGGAFPPRGLMHEYVDDFAGASVLVANLPGSTTPIANQDIKEITVGFRELIDTLLGDTPTVVCGISTGCLVTLGLTSPNIYHQVAVEPFLSTRDLWPFIEHARSRLAGQPESEHLRSFLWQTFGITAETVEDRDYGHLLDNLKTPTDVLVGELPLLPERPTPRWPSFTSEADRARLRAHPLVSFHEGPKDTGHSVASREGAPMLRALLHAALTRGLELCA